MFSKKIGNIHQNFGITKLTRKTMLQRDTSAPTFLWVEICYVITNVFGIFLNFLKCKSGKIAKLSKPKNWKKKNHILYCTS